MISSCPHCQKDLNLTKAQQEKIARALTALPAGKPLRLNCPFCKQVMEVFPSSAGGGEKSEPEVLKDVLYSEHTGGEDQDVSRMVELAAAEPPKPVRLPPEAPKPPDTGWLESGEFEKRNVVEDIPRVMIMMPDALSGAAVQKVFEGLGYQALPVGSAAEALDKMRFMNVDAIVLHSGFEGAGLTDSAFHRHMEAMAMARRRFIYYVLIGPEFHTLYDLQALAHSANLVVNDREIEHLEIIMKKGLHDYDALFGPYVEVLKQHGVK